MDDFHKAIVIMGGMFLTFIVILVMLGNSQQSDDAMTVCQLSHSYDVCFTALNK